MPEEVLLKSIRNKTLHGVTGHKLDVSLRFMWSLFLALIHVDVNYLHIQASNQSCMITSQEQPLDRVTDPASNVKLTSLNVPSS